MARLRIWEARESLDLLYRMLKGLLVSSAIVLGLAGFNTLLDSSAACGLRDHYDIVFFSSIDTLRFGSRWRALVSSPMRDLC